MDKLKKINIQTIKKFFKEEDIKFLKNMKVFLVFIIQRLPVYF